MSEEEIRLMINSAIHNLIEAISSGKCFCNNGGSINGMCDSCGRIKFFSPYTQDFDWTESPNDGAEGK